MSVLKKFAVFTAKHLSWSLSDLQLYRAPPVAASKNALHSFFICIYTYVSSALKIFWQTYKIEFRVEISFRCMSAGF